MPTVVYNISIQNVNNSGIVFGDGNTIRVNGDDCSFDEWAREAARIVARLSAKKRVCALSYLFALEDGRDIPIYKEGSA